MINLIGKRFGRLVVTAYAGKDKRGHAFWRAVCDCGNIVAVKGNNLMWGHTKSCGCLQKEVCRKLTVIKHGEARYGKKSKEYGIWIAMKQRCCNSKTLNYQRYGGRGITVCDRWKNSFANFLADMGRCPAGLSLDRIDNNGNYEPSNCRWATPKEQSNNRNPKGYLKVGLHTSRPLFKEVWYD
jgi:hypothetical protein